MLQRSLKRRLLASKTANRLCVAHAEAPSRPRKRNAYVSYLELEEEVQTRYGLSRHPSCKPEEDFSSQGCLRAEIDALIRLLPPDMQQFLFTHDMKSELVEVVMDLGRKPFARFPTGDEDIAVEPIKHTDLETAVAQVGKFGTDNRAGINETLHRISCLRNRTGDVIGLTCRVGRSIPGSAAMVVDLAVAGYSILLLGRPGVGKTTAIREVSRLLADSIGKRVVICDTSNEIGGDGDVPHPGIGRARRMQVPSVDKQHEVMIEAVENHMPEVVVIDEIGTAAETAAARTISQRGVQLIATAHGSELDSIIKNPSLVDLLGGIGTVTLGDDEAKRRGGQKSILERQGLPTFDVCVEMQSRGEWTIWEDVGIVVDQLLLGREPPCQVRMRCDNGRVMIAQHRLTPEERTSREEALARRSDNADPARGSTDAEASMDAESASVQPPPVYRDSLFELPRSALNRDKGLALGAQLNPMLMQNGRPMSRTGSAVPRQDGPAESNDSDDAEAWRDMGKPVREDASTNEFAVSLSAARRAAAASSRRESLRRQRLQEDDPKQMDFMRDVEEDSMDLGNDSYGSPYDGNDMPEEEEDEQAEMWSTKGVKIYAFGVQIALIQQAAHALESLSRVRLVHSSKDADLVLSTRAKMRTQTGRSLRHDARALGVPVLSLKGNTLSQCVGALRVVLGHDPMAGIQIGDSGKAKLADPVYGDPAAIARLMVRQRIER